jgi:peptidoglycan/LPS O-acetylase OafA/YrhL
MGRLLLLDLLRGCAALVVAVAHFSYYSGVYIAPEIAKVCVLFFFALSGYILTYVYGASISEGRISLVDFFWRRIARLYPLHIATTVFMVIAVVAVRQTFPWNAVTVFETVTMTQYFFGGEEAINPPAWSLSVEMWGGLLMFAIIKASLIGRTLLIGCVVGFYFFSSGPFQAAYGSGFVAFVIGWAIFQFERGRYFGSAPIPEGLMAVSGELSFGIYLWHVPITFVLIGAVRLIEIRFGVSILPSPRLFLIYIPATLLAAAISYQFFEVPAKIFLRSIFQPSIGDKNRAGVFLRD